MERRRIVNDKSIEAYWRRWRSVGRPEWPALAEIGGDPGVIGTAGRIVNAIPAVCAAPPGLLSVLDLPLVTGHGLMR